MTDGCALPTGGRAVVPCECSAVSPGCACEAGPRAMCCVVVCIYHDDVWVEHRGCAGRGY